MKPIRLPSFASIRGEPWAPALAGLALLLSACLFGGDDGAGGGGRAVLTEASLGETGLAGEYAMIHFQVEYGNGVIIDSNQVRIRGRLGILSDSGYAQRIWIGEDSTDTEGRIVALRARKDDRGTGEMELDLAGTGRTGKGRFGLRGDTLTWIVESAPSQNGMTPGFTETGRYVRAADG
jgi:hypothetical protein